jgi:hypothetical protein
MDDLAFDWNGDASLASELAVPIRRVSLRTAAHGRPISLILWRSDGSGLRIQSQMKDLAERTEVGVLAFGLVDAPFPDERLVDLPAASEGPIVVTKLLIAESGSYAESGVVLKGANDLQIVAVAGASPYTIAVKGVADWPQVFEPQYPVESYVSAPL